MTGEPLFSIVVPTFNRVNKLLITISTILKQSLTDFEIIIVDDGSTDGTAKIVSEKFTDDRIHIVTQKNSERGAARNNGFIISRGKYVVFFDSDDIMHVNHLEKLLTHIQKENNPFFLANKFDFVSETGKTHTSDMKKLKEGYYDYKLFLNGNPLACNVCVRRDTPELLLFEEDRKYSIKEDWMFLISNLKNHRIFISNDTTISMLDHEDRSMRSDNKLIIARTILAREWIQQKVSLSQKELHKLNAHVNYFCGIHSYLDDDRIGSLKFVSSAIRFGGLKFKYISLFLKSIVGRKLISTFR